MSRVRPRRSSDERKQDASVTRFIATARRRDPGKVRDVLARNPVKNLYGTDREVPGGLALQVPAVVLASPAATVARAFEGQLRDIADRLLSPRWRP